MMNDQQKQIVKNMHQTLEGLGKQMRGDVILVFSKKLLEQDETFGSLELRSRRFFTVVEKDVPDILKMLASDQLASHDSLPDRVISTFRDAEIEIMNFHDHVKNSIDIDKNPFSGPLFRACTAVDRLSATIRNSDPNFPIHLPD
jgi:hypothetical protein